MAVTLGFKEDVFHVKVIEVDSKPAVKMPNVGMAGTAAIVKYVEVVQGEIVPGKSPANNPTQTPKAIDIIDAEIIETPQGKPTKTTTSQHFGMKTGSTFLEMHRANAQAEQGRAIGVVIGGTAIGIIDAFTNKETTLISNDAQSYSLKGSYQVGKNLGNWAKDRYKDTKEWVKDLFFKEPEKPINWPDILPFNIPETSFPEPNFDTFDPDFNFDDYKKKPKKKEKDSRKREDNSTHQTDYNSPDSDDPLPPPIDDNFNIPIFNWEEKEYDGTIFFKVERKKYDKVEWHCDSGTLGAYDCYYRLNPSPYKESTAYWSRSIKWIGKPKLTAKIIYKYEYDDSCGSSRIVEKSYYLNNSPVYSYHESLNYNANRCFAPGTLNGSSSWVASPVTITITIPETKEPTEPPSIKKENKVDVCLFSEEKIRKIIRNCKAKIEIPIVEAEKKQVNGQDKWIPKINRTQVEVLAIDENTAASFALIYRKIAEIQIDLIKMRNTEPPFAVVPEWWQVRIGADRPQLVVSFAEKLPNGKLGRTRWPVTIPHYTGNKKPQLPSYRKGQWEGILTLKDNSKLIINAISKEEAERVINAIRPFINPAMLAGSHIKVGQRKGQKLKQCLVVPTSVRFFKTGQKDTAPTWSNTL